MPESLGPVGQGGTVPRLQGWPLRHHGLGCGDVNSKASAGPGGASAGSSSLPCCLFPRPLLLLEVLSLADGARVDSAPVALALALTGSVPFSRMLSGGCLMSGWFFLHDTYFGPFAHVFNT